MIYIHKLIKINAANTLAYSAFLSIIIHLISISIISRELYIIKKNEVKKNKRNIFVFYNWLETMLPWHRALSGPGNIKTLDLHQ